MPCYEFDQFTLRWICESKTFPSGKQSRGLNEIETVDLECRYFFKTKAFYTSNSNKVFFF